LVFFLEGNLMIPGIAVEKILKVVTGYGVHNLIDLGEPERIFFACLIKISIINTHPPIFILLGYKNVIGENVIGEPIRVVHFHNETGV
jgi:hypothetical protein